MQVLGLQLEYEGAPLRMEPKKKYLGRKMAERKRKKETGEIPPDAVSGERGWGRWGKGVPGLSAGSGKRRQRGCP